MASSILTQPIYYKSLDEVTNFVINDQISMRSKWAVAPYYYIKVDSIDGFYGADIASESHPIPHATGERSGDTYRKGKGISINGTIEGRTIPDMAAAARYLRWMFWEPGLRKLVWTEFDSTVVYLKCRVLNDLNISETYQASNPRWTWTVGLRADDPRERKMTDGTLFYTWMA